MSCCSSRLPGGGWGRAAPVVATTPNLKLIKAEESRNEALGRCAKVKTIIVLQTGWQYNIHSLESSGDATQKEKGDRVEASYLFANLLQM